MSFWLGQNPGIIFNSQIPDLFLQNFAGMILQMNKKTG
jgi:hypothetical protein